MAYMLRKRRLLGLGLACGVLVAGTGIGVIEAKASRSPQQSQAQQQTQSSSQQQNPPVDPAARKSPDPAALPASTYAARGKKLMMKDGSYQLVRSYEKNGEVVRYYSVERSQWEEIPTSLVDWDATTKASDQEKNQADALIAQVEKREEQQRAAEVMDVDASLEVSPGVLLPPGEGLFLVAGKNITQLNEVRTTEKLDKGQAIKKALVPGAGGLIETPDGNSGKTCRGAA